MEGLVEVSIVIPVYNMSKCLSQTLDSLISQTYKNIDLICINDGSTDDSLAILNSYAERDGRIRVYSQKNAGQGQARNYGLSLAQGDYVMLLDADDLYDAQFVEKMVKRADETEADIVVCRCNELDDSTGRMRRALWTAKAEQIPVKDPFNVNDMADYIFTAFVGWPWDKLYKRSFLEAHDLRFPDLENSEDLHFVFLALVKASRISFLDEVLITHRIGRAGSVSNSRKKAPLAFYDAICLLKSELRKDEALYQKLQWGFLNWAFDYAIWNIESMADQEAKAQVLREMAYGRLEELELNVHGTKFFSLEPDRIQRFALLCEALGIGTLESPDLNEKHPWLANPILFLNECKMRGFRSAWRKVAGRLTADGRMGSAKGASRGASFFFDDTNEGK